MLIHPPLEKQVSLDAPPPAPVCMHARARRRTHARLFRCAPLFLVARLPHTRANSPTAKHAMHTDPGAIAILRRDKNGSYRHGESCMVCRMVRADGGPEEGGRRLLVRTTAVMNADMISAMSLLAARGCKKHSEHDAITETVSILAMLVRVGSRLNTHAGHAWARKRKV